MKCITHLVECFCFLIKTFYLRVITMIGHVVNVSNRFVLNEVKH